jgi:hypothetical protein
MSMNLRPALLACAFAAVLMSQAVRAADDTGRDASPLVLADIGFALKLPKSGTVSFHGAVNYDGAGGPGAQMLYPAIGGIAGLLVGIATHGAIVEAQKNSEKAKLQEAADKVLDPYKETLAAFSNRELMERGMAALSMPGSRKLIEDANAGDDGWVVESVPTYTMTQDQTALVLENAVAVYRAGSTQEIRYQNVIRVVSDVHDEPELQAAWSAEHGKQLKEESVLLFAHSLRLVLEELAKVPKGEAPSQKTFRYSEGRQQKVERAELVTQACDRAIVKSLRGWLMSIPLRRPADTVPSEQCKTAARYST